MSALLIVEHHIEKRTAELQPEVLVDKTKFPELIHEKVNAATSDPHQFRRKLVAAMLHDCGNPFQSLRFVGFSGPVGAA